MSYGALLSSKLIAQGDFEEAADAATREMAQSPDDPEARFNRAQALAGLGRLEEAVVDYEQALALDPGASGLDPAMIDDELFDALRNLALKKRGDLPEALAILERYRRALPDGRHVADLAKWSDHVSGLERTWYRDRA